MKRKKTNDDFAVPAKNTRARQSDSEIKLKSMSPYDGVSGSNHGSAVAGSEIADYENISSKIVSSEDASCDKNYSRPLGFRVLIPINAQDSALYALEAAMARRWPENTQFMLTTVIEGLSGDSLEAKIIHRDILLAEQNEHRRAMKTWLNRLKDSFIQVFPNTEADLECGRIAEKICELACNWGADYIMVGSHDFNLVDRTALGSIASKVLMSAPCTVEAVRFHKLKNLAQSGSSSDTEKIRQLANQAPRRIIVATDFSKQADAAIQWIADSSWFDHTEIRLVTVTEASKREPGVAFLAGSKGYISEQQYQRTLEDRLRGLGREIAKKQPYCKLEVFVLQSDSVSGAILELASMWDADLVVVGAQGEGNTDEAKAGSTALPIMDCLECSAIAIRNPKRKQVHFNWYPELQNSEHRELPVARKVEAK
ncbi:universal stress protein [bacterium]|nr:universal stress protein [bacterium]